MTSVTVSYKDLLKFEKVAAEYLNNKEHKPSPLSWALTRNKKLVEKYTEEYGSKVAALQDKYQEKDKDGYFAFHDEERKQAKFKPADHAAFRKAFNDLQNEVVTLEVYQATSVPTDLELAWYEYFVPFVIAELPQ